MLLVLRYALCHAILILEPVLNANCDKHSAGATILHWTTEGFLFFFYFIAAVFVRLLFFSSDVSIAAEKKSTYSHLYWMKAETA